MKRTVADVTPVFWANKEAYDSKLYRVIANQGSTRSSKTFSICQLIPAIATTEKKEITVCSPSLPHLKRGARKDFLDIIRELNIYNDDDFNKTDNVYRFPKTGSYVEFFGADEVAKLRGPGRDILYINEANLISHASYIQMALRTKEVIFIDFNPVDEFSWVYDVADAPGNKLIHSTYRNNIANLTKQQIEEIESLKDADENLWKVFGLGLRGTSSETIYTHWKICDELPNKGERWYGQDFGYNVPSALVEIEFYEGALYWDQALYETKLVTSDLVERYKILGIDRRKEIYCDNAEPKTIEELRRAGYNALPADKDVTEGIRFCKGLPLYITRRSVEGIKEMRSYKWKVDKDGKVLDDPVKFQDHFCDGGRYGSFTKLRIPKRVYADASY